MGKKFKKIMAVMGSTFMIGATLGLAGAAGGGFPTPFIKDSNTDYAIVYGTNSATSDATGANSLQAYLNTFCSSDITKTNVTENFSSSVSIEDDVELGSESIIGSKLKSKLEDNKISTLLDTKIDWDNGDGTESYDVHEEILLTPKVGNSKLKLVTNLHHTDGEDLDSFVVLQNDESLRYRLVFDDLLEFSDDDEEDAQELRVSILGKEYEITDFNDEFDSVTISLSEEKVVKKGTVLNVEGVTLTIGEIFDYAVEVNDILVKEEGSIKTINGIEVQVTSTASHSDSTLSKAIIKVGKDIKRNIDNGDEYIKDDETWEWDIGTANGKQYIGVKYALSNVDYDEDDTEENPISSGESYIFPENYAAVSFDKLTDVEYNNFEVFFDDKDLYQGETKTGNNINVVILEGENDDSITLTYDGMDIETDSIYFNYSEGNVSMYFKDIDGDADSDKKGRVQFSEMFQFGYDIEENPINVSHTDIAKLVVDDTEVKVGLDLNDDTTVDLTLTINGKITKIPLGISSSGEFTHLGTEAEESEAKDIVVDNTNIGTRDYDVMDNYGIIIKDPESNTDNDKVTLSIPSEQVFAEISIKGQGEVITTETNESTDFGGIVIKDSEINNVKDKNLILVGGSCINAEAAKLLGGKACGEEFTLKTGVTAGKALIQTFASLYDGEKVAIVVAGYNAADTTKAVNSFINSDLDISIGQKHII